MTRFDKGVPSAAQMPGVVAEMTREVSRLDRLMNILFEVPEILRMINNRSSSTRPQRPVKAIRVVTYDDTKVKEAGGRMIKDIFEFDEDNFVNSDGTMPKYLNRLFVKALKEVAAGNSVEIEPVFEE